MIMSKKIDHSEAQILWEKMRKGDKQALADLFKHYYAFLYDYGMELSNQAELVKDSIQEVFAYMWEKRKTISKANSVRAYLLVSMRRHLLKSLQRQHLRQYKHQEFSHDYPEEAFSVEDLLIMSEEMDNEKKLLRQALNDIPSRIREALYLKTYHRLSYKEIAIVMNISSQVARNYVSEAFHRLREILADIY